MNELVHDKKLILYEHSTKLITKFNYECYFSFCYLGRLCIWILVLAIDTLYWMVSKIYFRKNLIFVNNHYVMFWRVAIDVIHVYPLRRLSVCKYLIWILDVCSSWVGFASRWRTEWDRRSAGAVYHKRYTMSSDLVIRLGHQFHTSCKHNN